jgi:hypothetical protein
MVWVILPPVSDRRCVMAKKLTEGRRKLVEFDAPTWHALNLLSRESMKSFQELVYEAFRNLLHKQGRPTDLKSALRESAKGSGKRRPRATRYI